MQFRTLGRTGLQVSELCLGCMMFGGRTTPADSQAIIDRSLDAGINFLDTADVYTRGRSEEVTGEALRRSGKRDRVILATKVHGRMADDDPNRAGNTRHHIIAGCEASLRRLQTDHVDLYQIHRPAPEVPIDETLRALDDLVRSGKVRYIGTSTYSAWQTVESLWVSERLHLNRFVTEQPPYNLLDRRIERELIPMAQTFGIGLIPWSPLAGGLLSGKYRRDAEPPAGSRFENQKETPHLRNRYHDGVFAALEKLTPLALAKGCTLSQLALAWCRTRPGITCPIIGPRTLEQLEDNLGALHVTLDPEDLERIDAACPPGRMISPFYEAAFGPHPHRV